MSSDKEKQKCKKLEELPVVSDGQLEVRCPKCAHFFKGQCLNPTRHSDKDACPFDGKPLPTVVVS